jgi:aminomethyltransferase
MTTSPALYTPLYENHLRQKAKMTAFGGFMLPVWFSSLKDEHMAVRKNAGIFDISHMGLIEISGTNAKAFLQHIVCNDVNKSASQKMIYAMVLNKNGCILDDVMFGQWDETGQRFLLVVNASNKGKILAWLRQHNNGSSLTDINATHGFLAIQGPNAASRLDQALGTQLASSPRFSLRDIVIDGHSITVLRSGYTGEDGFECIIPNDYLETFWNRCTEAGIIPCGLAARDSLRLEAGLPLYGQELSESITPLMTRYPWVIAWDKEFIGKEALVELKTQAKSFVTVGLEMEERIIPRSHYPIKEGGEITSGTLSPSLDKPIAMALVHPTCSEIGAKVHVEIRGKLYAAKVVDIPFI